MKYLLLVAAFAAASSAAVIPEDKSLFSSISSGVSTAASSISNAAALASSLTGSSNQCQQNPVNLTALQNILPPALASLATEKNVETLQGVTKLAGLTTAAATGNPIAIVKLVLFLASPESPVDDLIDLVKEIAPHLTPAEVAASFPSKESLTNALDTVSSAAANQYQQIENQVGQIFNKDPVPVASAA